MLIVIDVVGEEERVPHFWLLALGNHPVTEQLLEAEDIPALEELEDIQISYTYNEDLTTFTLSFLFRENNYFKNKVCRILFGVFIVNC